MKKGFTLIELLVVIVIIALLAAIIFPVYIRVKEQGRKAACLSNLKQLAAALSAYRGDYDGHMPGSVYREITVGSPPAIVIEKHCDWANALNVGGKVFKCPSDDGPEGLSYANNRFLFGFLECGDSENVYKSPETGVVGRDDVWLPSLVIVLCDGDNTTLSDPKPLGGIDDVPSRRSGWFTYTPPAKTADRRHLGKGNYAFWDGHVESLLPNQVGRDSAGGGGTSIAQAEESIFNDGGYAQCAFTKKSMKDTEPWWGPGLDNAIASSGGAYAGSTGIADPISGSTPSNIWGQCGHNFKSGIPIRNRNDFYGHTPAWNWGGESDDLGPGRDDLGEMRRQPPPEAPTASK